MGPPPATRHTRGGSSVTSTTRPVGGSDLSTDNLGALHRLTPAEARNVAVSLAAYVLRHPCQLDPEAGVTECTHPAHDADAAECRFAVEVFGVASAGSRPRTNPSGTRKRVRGVCSVCGTRRYITLAGVVLAHDTAAGDRCGGSLEKPAGAAGAERRREAS
jgi:hypothetical protein